MNPKPNKSRSRKTKKTVKAANGAAIVEGMAEAQASGKKPCRAERKLAEFYAKYDHVKPNSVRHPNTKEAAQMTKCHGKVCTIMCEECGTERVINTQDAFQVRYCVDCQAKRTKEIRKTSRKRRLARRAEAKRQREAAQAN